MSVIPPELAEALASRYRIVREIGHGGMAIVYQAIDSKHGRDVAIKVLRPELTAGIGRDRFLREIATVAGLNHPHILSLHDSGATEQHLYFVMPYVSGESLRARLDRERQLPLEEALRLTRELAGALGYAHHQGLIHRDLKPENVLLSDGIALLADFGIARAVENATFGGDESPRTTALPAETGPGVAIGTPRYMSPEQAVGEAVDERSDVYALGCVLYEMLAGQPPFPEQAIDVLLRRHLSEVPRTVTAHRASIPEAISSVIAQALAKSPAQRPATMGRFAEALAGASAATTPAAGFVPVNTPHNLPRPRSRFIGRARELGECASILGETRLLTITGIGGSSKTRLALELAKRRLADHPDGTWFVDLAPLHEADQVAQAVAIALAVRELPGTPLVDTLADHLASRRTLLVLDNCEHVLIRAGELVDRLLADSTELQVVATSREALGIEGERTLPLGSLSLPDAMAAPEVGRIDQSDAVRLFLDRARVADARFELNEQTASSVAEICRRLDGIPLAVELAAARVKMLTVEQIHVMLDDRFRLLGETGVSTLARQKTLRATIQWSYDQLSAADRRLFRWLAVFAGGWTLAGATFMAGDGCDEFAVLDAITRIAEKSLLGVERDGGEARYWMLETVRQFAHERLLESGERDEARTRHVDCILCIVEEAGANLHGPDQRTWIHRLDRERENLLLAHSSCNAIGGLPRCQALIADGQLGFFLGRTDEARGHLLDGLSIARELAEPILVMSALRSLGAIEIARGDMSTARRHMEDALLLARQSGDRIRLAIALSHLAELDRAEGKLASAERLYEESLVLCRELEKWDNTAVNLLNLAMLSVGRGAPGRARGLLREALAIAEEVGSRYSGKAVLEVFSALAISLAEWERGARLDGAAERLRESMGVPWEPVDEAFFTPLLARAREGLGTAAFGAAKSAGRALDYETAIAEASSWLERNT